MKRECGADFVLGSLRSSPPDHLFRVRREEQRLYGLVNAPGPTMATCSTGSGRSERTDLQ